MAVSMLAVTSDGRLLAGTDGQVVKLYDARSGAEIRSFKPHDVGTETIAFSPDGKILATGGCDKMKEDEEYKCETGLIRFWDAATGREVRTFPGHPGYVLVRGERWNEAEGRNETVTMYIGGGVEDIDFTPDGNILASIGHDDKMIIWDLETGREIKKLESRHFYFDIDFSPDGTILAAGNQEGILLLNWRTGEDIIQLLDNSGSAPFIFSRDGRMIAAACGDETIKVWDITKPKEIRTFFGHADDPQAVAFSADGKIVASGGFDDKIFLWDMESGQEITRLTGHRATVFDLVLSPDGNVLLSGGGEKYVGGEFVEGTIRYWDATSFAGKKAQPAAVAPGMEARQLEGHNANVAALAFKPGGNQLASVSEDGVGKIWDVETGREVMAFEAYRMHKTFEAVEFSPDGRYIATGGGVLQLLDAQTGQELFIVNSVYNLRSVAFSPRGRILAYANTDFEVPIWDVESNVKLAGLTENIKGEGYAIHAVAFSPDGSLLASAGSRVIKIWDLQTEKAILKWEAHAPYITSIAFSPDGKLLASAGWDRVVKLWDVQTGKLVKAMSGHRGYVLSLSFSPDGKTLASGSDDFTIRLWDIATGKSRKTFTEKYFIEDVAISPDGHTLAAAVYKYVKLWKM